MFIPTYLQLHFKVFFFTRLNLQISLKFFLPWIILLNQSVRYFCADIIHVLSPTGKGPVAVQADIRFRWRVSRWERRHWTVPTSRVLGEPLGGHTDFLLLLSLCFLLVSSIWGQLSQIPRSFLIERKLSPFSLPWIFAVSTTLQQL